MRAATNGGSTTYDSTGSGPPLILIHGFIGDRTSFSRLAPLLSQHYRVIVYDQRDSGGTEFAPMPYTAADLADDLVALMDELRLDRAHILGTSFGGAIAQETALSHPDRVDRLVLAATTRGTQDLTRLPDDVRAAIIDAASGTPESAQQLAGMYFSRRARADRPELIEDYLRRPDTRDTEQRARRYAVSGSFDSTDRLTGLTRPTLVLAGADDRFAGVGEAMTMFEAIPDATLVAVKDVGHLWQDEAPERYAGLIRSFLADPR